MGRVSPSLCVLYIVQLNVPTNMPDVLLYSVISILPVLPKEKWV